MSKLDSMKDRKFVFGSVLMVANRMDTLLERELKEYDVTAKQWFLTVCDSIISEKRGVIERRGLYALE